MNTSSLLKPIEFSLFEKQTVLEAVAYFAQNGLNTCPIMDSRGRIKAFVSACHLLQALHQNIELLEHVACLPFKAIDEQTDLESCTQFDFAYFVIQEPVCLYASKSELIQAIYREKIQKLEITDVFFESSYDGIYITNEKADTLRINQAYERITGLDRKDLLGRNMRDLVEEGFISESGTLKALSSGRSITLSQSFKTGRKGLITSIPVKGPNGDVTCVVTNVRDITELSDLRDAALKNKALADKYFSEIGILKAQLFSSTDFQVSDPKMIEIITFANKIAQTDSTVLLLGESGVGKEEIAKVIHKNSSRCDAPFLKVNCGAIPKTLIESELFGYEKGAFTGSNSEGKLGIFEAANQGTLFLDEIGELPLDMQVKLLRVLQESEFTRIGGTRPIRVDTRIISATNRNLERMTANGTFRKDLFYRLNVIPLQIPPLRERKKDILPIVMSTLSRLNDKYNWNKSFTQDALDILEAYDWPGNVRELNNIVERSVVTSSGSRISCADLPKYLIPDSDAVKGSQRDALTLDVAVEALEKQMLERAFEAHGNVRDAAKALGIGASTFVRKRKKYL